MGAESWVPVWRLKSYIRADGYVWRQSRTHFCRFKCYKRADRYVWRQSRAHGGGVAPLSNRPGTDFDGFALHAARDCARRNITLARALRGGAWPGIYNAAEGGLPACSKRVATVANPPFQLNLCGRRKILELRQLGIILRCAQSRAACGAKP